ncbi:MAG: adenylate/guanylate cyclase domain-containing protein [Pseudomonadota bacterium]
MLKHLRPRTRYRLLLFVVLWLVSMLSGLLYGLLFLPDGIGPWVILDEVALGGAIVWGFLLFVLPSRYGRPIRWLAFPVRLVVIVVFILAMIPLTVAVIDLVDPATEGILSPPPTLSVYLFALAVVALAALGVEVARMIGPRVLGSVLIGRYQSPVEEHRVFLFVDLVGSTQIAQRLGPVRYQRLLCRYFFDLGEPVLEAGGELYAYVGDGMIVSWRLRPGDARPVTCFFDIQDTLDRTRRRYAQVFGAEPQVRGALHGGAVVAAACGDARRAIVYFGETLNAAARLEEQAKRQERELVAVADFASSLDLPTDIAVEPLGPAILRGLEGQTELVAFSRPEKKEAPQVDAA